MGFRVDYNMLDAMFDQLTAQAATWDEELNTVKDALERLQNTSNMSGVGADAARNYLSMIQIPMVSNLISLVEMHKTNFMLYKTDYQQSIDSGFDTIIDEDELGDIGESLDNMKAAVVNIDEEVRSTLRQIRDIFTTSFGAVDGVADAIGDASIICSTLSQNIKTLESEYMRTSFAQTEPIIDLLTSEIKAYLTKDRNFKANFDPNSAEAIGSRIRMNVAGAVMVHDLHAKEKAANAAMEYHESRKEMVKRIEAAKWEKLLVTATVVVGSAVLIGVLPVSGPLVVGLVSGASSAIISGNNEAMDLYIEDGDISGSDWNRIATEGGKGFAVGFATGVVGGVTGKALSGLTKGIPGLHSANFAVNATTHVVVGATSEVVSGVATRTTGEIVDQLTDDVEGDLDWDKVRKEAFDPAEMGKDAVLGGMSGYMDGHKVDYDESMNSEYEKSVLEDMYKKGELDYTVDPELDALDAADKKNFFDYLSDYTVKKKEGYGAASLDDLLSPDDYSKDEYEQMMRVNKAIDKAKKVDVDDFFKSHDEIAHDLHNGE